MFINDCSKVELIKSSEQWTIITCHDFLISATTNWTNLSNLQQGFGQLLSGSSVATSIRRFKTGSYSAVSAKGYYSFSQGKRLFSLSWCNNKSNKILYVSLTGTPSPLKFPYYLLPFWKLIVHFDQNCKGISMTSSSMISPCGAGGMLDAGFVLHERSENGLNQDKERGPPNANFIASQHVIFSHVGASPFSRSIPWKKRNICMLRYENQAFTGKFRNNTKWNPFECTGK